MLLVLRWKRIGKNLFFEIFFRALYWPMRFAWYPQDDYYFPVAEGMTKEENKEYNFDLPTTIDHDHFEQDIYKLLNHQSITKKEYTFNNASAVPKMLEIKPAPILIVEGLFILHFKKIAAELDMKIFIDAHENIALQRRLKRDLLERGYSHDDAYYKWVNHVLPAYKEYLLPYKDECDRVIINNSHVCRRYY